MGWFKNILLIFIAVVITAFCVMNRHFVTVSLYPIFSDVEIRLFILLLFTLMFGVLAGMFIGYVSHLKKVFKSKKEEKEKKELVEEGIKDNEK